MIYTVSIDRDDEKPTNWSYVTYLTWTRNYNSIDENPYHDLEEFAVSMGVRVGDSIDDLIRFLDRHGIIAAPIYKYEHGLVQYSTTPFLDKWDSGLVGIAYVSKDDVLKEYGGVKVGCKMRARVIQYMGVDLDLYSMWCNGDVYRIDTINGDGSDGETRTVYGCENIDTALEEMGYDPRVDEVIRNDEI